MEWKESGKKCIKPLVLWLLLDMCEIYIKFCSCHSHAHTVCVHTPSHLHNR